MFRFSFLCFLKEKVDLIAVVMLSVVKGRRIHALFHQYFYFKCHCSDCRLEKQVRFAEPALTCGYFRGSGQRFRGHVALVTLCVHMCVCV